MAAVAGKPLRLKDLLELDCDSCSAAGFRCYPRHLCVAVPLPLPARHEAVFGRSHSMLSIRSLSRRLRGSFSWGRRDEEAPAPVPVPAALSCSSDPETSESWSSSSSADRKSESDFSSASTAESRSTGATTAADGREHEAMESESKEEGTGSGSGSEADDKEQLSPVAVMDFPFHDDDAVEDGGTSDGGSACSPSPFSDSLAQLHQRRNIRLKHKLPRSRSTGEAPAADLGDRFAAASEPDGVGNVPLQHRCPDSDAVKPASRLEGHRRVDLLPDEDNLIAQLTSTFSAGNGSERLLLDFFAETQRLGSTTESCEAVVRVAQDWVQDAGARWGLREVLCGREDLLAEMDRGQRWASRVGEKGEEREVGAVVADLVADELLRELVHDLLL